MPMRTEFWGNLKTRIIEPASTGDVALNVIMSHGYGATGTDLVPLASMLAQIDGALADRVRYIFPQAPYDLAEFDMPGGRAWWHLDILQLQRAVATGEFRDLINESPKELSDTRKSYQTMLAESAADTGVPISRTVLGGFSQGAMLSLDACLFSPERPAGLIIWSGSYINQKIWRERVEKLSGLAVLQSHGRFDPLLPIELAMQLRDELQDAGNTVEFVEFPGQHEIPMEVLERTATWLRELGIRNQEMP
jgi:phospholipase/carboxylesterase